MVIDNCQKAKIEDSDPPKINRSRCETKMQIPPFNEFLNVNTPMQLGGVHHQYLTDYRWQHQHTREGFEGCIKNVIHNSEASSVLLHILIATIESQRLSELYDWTGLFFILLLTRSAL